MFFQTCEGETHPVSSITRIETKYRESNEVFNAFDKLRVHLTTGDIVMAYRHEVDSFSYKPVSSFPANPGTSLVCHDENPEVLYFKPVLGWVVYGSGKVRPALTHGIFDDPHEAWVIRTSDGVVTDENAGWWPSIDAYRAYAIDEKVLA